MEEFDQSLEAARKCTSDLCIKDVGSERVWIVHKKWAATGWTEQMDKRPFWNMWKGDIDSLHDLLGRFLRHEAPCPTCQWYHKENAS